MFKIAREELEFLVEKDFEVAEIAKRTGGQYKTQTACRPVIKRRLQTRDKTQTADQG